MRGLGILLSVLSLAIGTVLRADEARRRRLLSVIDEELREVTRLDRQTRGRKPTLLLRKAELYLEKARIVRESENERYLSIPYKERRRKKKAGYFRASRSYFQRAQKTCTQILKRHKRFSGIGDVYYIMAYNAKEFNQHKKSERYFKLAVKKSKRGSISYKKAQIALAEIYYNKGKYSNSIRLYEKALSKRDKWWTKDAVNLSWSYFRTNNKTKAISLMKEIQRLSQDRKFIDMSSAVERDLAYFYVHSGMIRQAADFYKSKGQDVGKKLVKVAKGAQDTGKPKVAQKILEDALRYAQNDDRLKVEIYVALLSLYEQYGNTAKHLGIAGELVNMEGQGKLDPEQKELLLFQVKKMAAVLQKQVGSKRYRHNKKLLKQKGESAIAYFSLAERLEKTGGADNTFHSGETLYAVGQYDKAVEKYLAALEKAKRRNDRKIIAQTLNSLLATLGQKRVGQGIKNRYLERVYLEHIRLLPNSRKNEQISERLFNHYMERKELVKAEKTLNGYQKLYPKNRQKQEAMVAKIMDHYRNTGDRKNFFAWMGKIKRMDYRVSKKYLDRLEKIYLSMEFKKVEEAHAQGDKKKAIQGYLAIYKGENTSKEAKKNSAYNLAILFKDAGSPELTYKWTTIALKMMDTKDVKKYAETFNTLANTLFNQLELKKSGEVHELIVDRLCKVRSKEKTSSFSNASALYLSENDFDGAKRLLSKANRCKIPKSIAENQRLALLKGFSDSGRWIEFEMEMNAAASYKKNYPSLIEYLERYRNVLARNGRRQKADEIKNKIYNYYRQSKKNGYPIPLESLDVIAGYEIDNLEKEGRRLASVKLRFPEQVFNSTVQKKLKDVGKLEEKALGVMKIGSGIGIVKANKVSESAYKQLIEDILSFTPPNKSQEYVTGFKKSMENLANSLKAKTNSIRQTAKGQILKDKILSHENYWFLQASSNVPFPLQYFFQQQGVVMDKGGQM